MSNNPPGRPRLEALLLVLCAIGDLHGTLRDALEILQKVA